MECFVGGFDFGEFDLILCVDGDVVGGGEVVVFDFGLE